jgi:hypothetical protein
MHVTFAPPSSACVLVSISQPLKPVRFLHDRGFRFLDGVHPEVMQQSVKRALKNNVFAGRRTRTEYLSFDAKCSVVAKITIHGIFVREISKYTAIYSVYIPFWPTLSQCNA